MKLKPFVQNPLKSSEVRVLVENFSTQIPTIKSMLKPACFVGARWSWHRVLSCRFSKTEMYQRLNPNQRGLTPLISPISPDEYRRIPKTVDRDRKRHRKSAGRSPALRLYPSPLSRTASSIFSGLILIPGMSGRLAVTPHRIAGSDE